MSLHRRTRAPRWHSRAHHAVVALGVVGAVLTTTTSPAHAVDGFRYWSAWEGSVGTWTEPESGPGQWIPEDGDTLGWRFAVIPEATEPPQRTPRGIPDFTQVCGQAPAEYGQKRVAVVIDFGTELDAPSPAQAPDPTAMCAVVPWGLTAEQTLRAVTEVADGGEGICSVADYPAGGCQDNRARDLDLETLEQPEESVDINIMGASHVTTTPPEAGESRTPGQPPVDDPAFGPSDKPGVQTGDGPDGADASAGSPGEEASPTTEEGSAPLGQASAAESDQSATSWVPWGIGAAVFALLGLGLWALLGPDDRPLRRIRTGRRPPRRGA